MIVSGDIEADGPIPGIYSMLSLGSAIFSDSGELIDTFSINLNCLEGAKQHQRTMAWWGKNQEAWKACRESCVEPYEGMKLYLNWLNTYDKLHTFVGYPASFDFMFVYWYLIKFVGESPFGFSALDLKSYATAKLNKPFRSVTKRTMPREWFGAKKHTHIAVDDAIEQGELYFKMKGN